MHSHSNELTILCNGNLINTFTVHHQNGFTHFCITRHGMKTVFTIAFVDDVTRGTV